MRSASATRFTILALFSGGAAVAWAVVIFSPRIAFLIDPASSLEGVWRVDYAESSDAVLASGLWREYDFESTGRLNGSDGFCTGPLWYWRIRGNELHLHQYDPLAELIPLPPDAGRPADLLLGRPSARYLLTFVNKNKVLLEDCKTVGRVALHRVVGARRPSSAGRR